MILQAEAPRGKLRCPPSRQPMFHRIFRADPLTVRDALTFLRQRFAGTAGEEVIARVELALAEVLNNICEHGSRPSVARPTDHLQSPLIHLCVIRHVGGIACAITDDGKPLPTECLDRRSLPYISAEGDDDAVLSLPEGGFGWYLIQDLTASLSYFREGRRNFLAFIVPIDSPEASAAAARLTRPMAQAGARPNNPAQDQPP
ncbi:MAG: ATP-binding protein [Paracoccus sp. (in: a-proteobacteria)]|uniref:ATP-binding protein n=1 Tax=Paracoccus sp. TaxID=267 RepID=UPI0039E4BF21